MHVTDDHLLASVRISKCESNEFSQAWKHICTKIQIHGKDLEHMSLVYISVT